MSSTSIDPIQGDEKFLSRGYGDDVPIPTGRWAAIVVDFQRGLTQPISPLGGGEHIRAAVDTASGVLTELRALGVPVLHTVQTSSPDGEQDARWRIRGLDVFVPGSPYVEVDPDVWADGDRIVSKEYPSAFFGTSMASKLRVLGVENVAILGCVTSGCVRASAVDAFSNGFSVVVVEDACGDQDPNSHRSNLADISRRYGHVMRGAEIVELITNQSKEITA